MIKSFRIAELLQTGRLQLILLSLLCLPATSLKGQHQDPREKERSEIWAAIAPFFEPPAEYRESFGDFRSPLKFNNGEPVTTARQWKKRRKEILTTWHGLMGEWPPLMKGQKPEYIESVSRDTYIQHHISFFWTPDEKTDGYLLVPHGKGKKPAVIIVYYDPETAIGEGNAKNRDFACQLTKLGFVTLSIGTRKASAEKNYSIYYPDIGDAKVQPLSMLACAAANAWIVCSNVKEVDASRIGIMGHSFGGKWAMFASCLYPKFACAVWSDPGIVFEENRESVNYWEPWYLGYHPKPWRKRGLITVDNPAKGLYPQLIREGYNLTDLHALMAPRPFLVSGGSEDTPARWTALNHTVAVNRLLGSYNKVAMTNRADHSPNEESNHQIALFFRYFLNPLK